MVRCGARGGTDNSAGDVAKHRDDGNRDWPGRAAGEEDGARLCAEASAIGEREVTELLRIADMPAVRHRDYTFLGTTQSLCPECLAVVPAKIVARQSHLAI